MTADNAGTSSLGRPPQLSVAQLGLAAGRGELLLDQLTFSLEAGDCALLLGRGGSGKTLLFRLLNGLLSPTQGQMTWQGHPLETLDALERRRQLAWVTRSPRLLGLPVKEAIAYPLRLQGQSDPAINQRLENVLQQLHIPVDWLERTAADLDLGQQWWVTLARAWISQPGLLLLELPLAWEQETGEIAIAGLKAGVLTEAIATFRTQGVAVILASRNPIATLTSDASQIWLLHQGKLQSLPTEDLETAWAAMATQLGAQPSALDQPGESSSVHNNSVHNAPVDNAPVDNDEEDWGDESEEF